MLSDHEAKPRISPERIVGAVCWSVACFLAGMEVAPEQKQIDLRPCPQYPMEKMASATTHPDGSVTCRYIKFTGGKAVKERKA